MKLQLLCLSLAVTLAGAAASPAAPASYTGAKRCKPCHLRQYVSWEKTRMAKSFELLKPGVKADEKRRAGLDPAKDYSADKECLACHVTGYLKPGGFQSLQATPELAGVQCESCHGAGSLYLAQNQMSLQNKEYKRSTVVAAGLVVPKADTCTTGCHNAKSPFFRPGEPFDFEKRKHDGTHEHLPLKYSH